MPDRKQTGFTLVELTVATLLLVTVVAGLFAAFVSANRWIKPQSAVASNVARERLETLFEAVRQDWWDVGGRPLSIGGPYADGTTTLDGVTYTRTYTVSSVSGTDYRKVEARVTWPAA